MKPYVVVHMSTSIDGRTLPSRWRPIRENPTPAYERIHEALSGDAWLVGRITGQEFARWKGGYPPNTGDSIPRETWLVR